MLKTPSRRKLRGNPAMRNFFAGATFFCFMGKCVLRELGLF
jgi:hypothetical protein